MTNHLTLYVIVAIGLFLAFGSFASAQAPDSVMVYFGTYTGPKTGSQGIYSAKLDLKTGALAAPQLAGEVVNPSFLEIHPDGKHLYCVGEQGGKKGGAVTAFAIDRATGKLTQLNQQSSVGGGPCHISIDLQGKNALVANYGGGSIAVLPIGADFKLAEASCFIQHTGKSVNPGRQSAPHAHSINLDAANQFAFVCDLGLDKVLIYRFDGAKGTLTANDPAFAKVADGAGPRHLAFHPSGKFVYVCNEMAMTVTAFAYDAAKGALTEIHTLSTLPASVTDYKGLSTAETRVHPSGKFAYVSNRGHDTIAIFTIDQTTGKLTAAGHAPSGGKTPRNFNIDPTGQFLIAAHQGDNKVTVFRIDPATGQLTPTGSAIEVGGAVCVRFLK